MKREVILLKTGMDMESEENQEEGNRIRAWLRERYGEYEVEFE